MAVSGRNERNGRNERKWSFRPKAAKMGPRIGPDLDPKWDPIWIQNGPRFGPQMGPFPDPNGAPFRPPNGSHFGPKTGPVLAPPGIAWVAGMARKRCHLPTKSKKPRSSHLPLYIKQGPEMGPFRDPKWDPAGGQNGTHSGPKMGPIPVPKRAPFGPKTGPVSGPLRDRLLTEMAEMAGSGRNGRNGRFVPKWPKWPFRAEMAEMAGSARNGRAAHIWSICSFAIWSYARMVIRWPGHRWSYGYFWEHVNFLVFKKRLFRTKIGSQEKTICKKQFVDNNNIARI